MLNRTLGAWGWALFVLGMLVTLAWPVWWASADEGLPSPGWVEMNQPHGLLAEEDLPSDFGGVSIDAAKRWVDANIQDWNDDLVEIRSHRVLSCAVAQAELAMLPATGLAMSSLLFIDQLSGLLGTAPGARQAAAPLNASLGELLVRVKLTPVESELARRLMGR